VSQSQSGIACNGALTIEYCGNAVRRHFELASQFRSTQVQRLEFFGKMLSRMDCHKRHCILS